MRDGEPRIENRLFRRGRLVGPQTHGHSVHIRVVLFAVVHVTTCHRVEAPLVALLAILTSIPDLDPSLRPPTYVADLYILLEN